MFDLTTRLESPLGDMNQTQSMVFVIISKLDPATRADLAVSQKLPHGDVLLNWHMFSPKLYNRCLAASYFSACWKSSVVPDFKNSDEHSDSSNYQPISLLPFLAKY